MLSRALETGCYVTEAESLLSPLALYNALHFASVSTDHRILSTWRGTYIEITGLYDMNKEPDDGPGLSWF